MSANQPTGSSDSIASSEPMEAKWKGTTAENCSKMVEYAKLRNPMVKFMIDKLEEVGSSIAYNRLRVLLCLMYCTLCGDIDPMGFRFWGRDSLCRRVVL